jgi:hypothetical protein
MLALNSSDSLFQLDLFVLRRSIDGHRLVANDEAAPAAAKPITVVI